MPQASSLLYIGVKGSVLALDRTTGTVVWRTRLKGSGFVNAVLDDGQLYATTQGQVFRLDPATGKVVWNNALPGMGLGLVTIATTASTQAVFMREKQKRDEEAAAAAAAGAGS